MLRRRYWLMYPIFRLMLLKFKFYEDLMTNGALHFYQILFDKSS